MLINALALTVIIECIALYFLKERDKIFYLYWGAVTSFTNLSSNLYIALVFSGNTLEYWMTAAVIEILVFVSEFLLCLAYTKDKLKSVKYSAICNIASFIVGLIILPIFI